MKKNIGAPPRYRTAAAMQKKIDEYFKLCEGEIWLDEEGKPFTTDKGALIYKVPPKPPTVTGLALALGFASRQALINYQTKDEDFNDTITRAKSRIEEYNETRLYDKEGVNGAKFNLSNNFGWNDKQEIKASVSYEEYFAKQDRDYEY